MVINVRFVPYNRHTAILLKLNVVGSIHIHAHRIHVHCVHIHINH